MVYIYICSRLRLGSLMYNITVLDTIVPGPGPKFADGKLDFDGGNQPAADR